MRNLLCLLLLSLFLYSCGNKQPAQQTPPPVSTATTEEAPKKAATTVENIGGYLGDASMFPYIHVEAINKLRFEAYTMKFSLEHPQNLIPLNNTDTPWINADNFSESNGQFLSYIRSGREAKLENPYMMVQYINKSLPFCSSIDSVYHWLDSRFLETGAKGEVMTDFYELDTQSGKKAICKSYRTPNTPDGRAAKRMGYAYIDYNDTYIIGMNLSTLSESDFEVSRPDFEQLVRSFNLPQ